MSWQVLKKAINKAGALVLKNGQVEDTADLDFDFEEKRYRSMEKVSMQLETELRHYLESLRTFTDAQQSISLVLSGFYDHDEHTIAYQYNIAMKEMAETCIDELEGPFLKTVINPIERFNSYYASINDAIKNREKKKNAYDSLRAKLRKLDANPTDDPSYELKMYDLSNELEQARLNYATFNDRLKSDLPSLVNMRIPYLNPLFEAFVKVQLRFFNENYIKLQDAELHLDSQTRQDYVTGALETKMDNILDKIKELNIAI